MKTSNTLLFGRRAQRLFAAVFAVGMLFSTSGIVNAQVDPNAPWRSPQGRACIQGWINMAMNRLNSSNLGNGYNERKPWRINQYGLILGRKSFSNYRPDFWGRLEAPNQRYQYVWMTYNRDSFSGLWTGSFSFLNRANPPIPSVKDYVRNCVGGGGRPPRVAPAPPRVIPSGKVVLQRFGRLTAGRFDRSRRSSYAQVIRVSLRGGTTYTIDLASGRFDTYLRLENSQGVELKRDDDSGSGLDSRIVFTPRYTGTYNIVITSYRARATGDYVLRISV